MFKEHRGTRVALVTTGAGSEAEAIGMARGYLERRGYNVAYLDCSPGIRMKVGVAGLRRYRVAFTVLGGAS